MLKTLSNVTHLNLECAISERVRNLNAIKGNRIRFRKRSLKSYERCNSQHLRLTVLQSHNNQVSVSERPVDEVMSVINF